jgi:imidazolonepropionase-like amidohydrolase
MKAGLLVLIALSSVYGTAMANGKPFAILHATVIDGTGREPVKDGAIVIRDGKIASVGSARTVDIPKDAVILDERGRFVVPGLMDANVHLTGNDDLESLIRFEHQYDRIALEAAQVTLKSGVTTVFDTAGAFDAVITARDRINRHEVVGSRIYFGGHIIGFGGPLSSDHTAAPLTSLTRSFIDRVNNRWVQGVGPELSWMGPDDVRGIVAGFAARPIDFLKYGASGHKEEQLITFSQRVQNVIVEDGHQVGKTVQAHAISPESFDMALNAGVDIVTHCDITGPDVVIPSDTLRKMRERGTFCSILPVTQRLVDSLVAKYGKDNNFVRHNIISRQNDRNLIAAGVPLMISTDGWLDNPIEAAESDYPRMDSRIILGEGIFNALVALEEIGMPPLEILKTATLNVAKGYRVDRDIGSLQVGKSADLVVLERDPLLAARNYRTIDLVIKEGNLIDRSVLPTDSVITSQQPSK